MKSVFDTHLWRSCTLLALLACGALLAQPATCLRAGRHDRQPDRPRHRRSAATRRGGQGDRDAPRVGDELRDDDARRRPLCDSRHARGGGYLVTVEHGGTGSSFEPQIQEDVVVNLGVTTDLDFIVRALAVEVTVTAPQSDTVFSSERTGASTSVSRETLSTLPTISQRLQDITRLTPQAGGNNTFAGQDNRMNNITVDGSYFNNSFGLAGSPGDRTGVAPISLAAIEQVQVSIAPFDVRQGNFVGAGVNTVTRSGTNDFRGSSITSSATTTSSAPRPWRDGQPGHLRLQEHRLLGGRPDLRNRAFFFFNYENETPEVARDDVPREPGRRAGGRQHDARARSDLDQLSSFLNSSFGYATVPTRTTRARRRPALPVQGRTSTSISGTRSASATTTSTRHGRARLELLVARASAPAGQHDGAELPELELPDHGEHPVGHRRVERDHRRPDVEQPDRRLHDQR
jgi:hypothetical protein